MVLFSLFHYYLPLKKRGVALHLNKLESTPPMNVLCKVSLKLIQWFWKRRFLKFCQCNLISLLSALGKRHGPSFEQTWILVIKECFVPSLFEIAPVVLEKKIKTWRISNDIDNDDNNDVQQTSFDQKSSLEQLPKGQKVFTNAKSKTMHIKTYKRSKGHIGHMRKPRISFLKIAWSSFKKKLNHLYSRGCSTSVWL